MLLNRIKKGQHNAAFFWWLLILLGSVWLGLKIAQDPGYALFSYRHWSVEMPLWFAALSLLVLLFVMFLVMRFFDSIDFSLYRLKNWMRWRRKYKAYSKTNRGLVELIEGHWRSAEYYLLEGVSQSDAPLINYLAAAKAAHEQGAFDRRDSFLRKAHDVAPSADVAIGLTQARLQFDQGQLEQTLATLGHLRQVVPKHAFVLKLLEKVYVRLADWPELLKLTPYLRKAKLINEDELQKLQAHTYVEILRNTSHKPDALNAMRQVWKTIPKKIQLNPNLLGNYAKLLLPYSETGNELEELINKALKNAWDPQLVKLYGLLHPTDPKKQLSHAQAWHKKYGNQAVLLLTLGRLAMHCQLWGKARSYFEESLKVEVHPDTYAEYGKLLVQLGEVDSAVQLYRDGLKLASEK